MIVKIKIENNQTQQGDKGGKWNNQTNRGNGVCIRANNACLCVNDER